MAEVDVFADVRARNGDRNPKLRQVNVVLEAITAVITESGVQGTPPPTAYFAAIMTAIESDGAAHAEELFYLLSVVMPQVPPVVLRSKFQPVCKLLTAAMQAPKINDNAPALRSVLSCVGAVLQAQEPTQATWSHPSSLGLFNALLAFATDARPKIRKSGQTSVLRLLRVHKSEGFTGLVKHLTAFVVSVLESSGAEDFKSVLQLLSFLRSVMPLMGAPVKVFKQLLRLAGLGNTQMSTTVFRVVASTLSSPSTEIPVDHLVSIGSYLTAVRPPAADYGPAAAYSHAITMLIKKLHLQEAGDLEAPDAVIPHHVVAPHSTAMLAATVAGLVEYLDSPKDTLYKASAAALAVVLYYGLDVTVVADGARQARAGRANPTMPRAPSVAEQVISSVDSVLQYRYQHAWVSALPVLSVLAKCVGATAPDLLFGLVQKLASMRHPVAKAAEIADSAFDIAGNRPQHKQDLSAKLRELLDNAFGALVVYMGPAPILSVMKLDTSLDGSTVDPSGVHEDKAWLLPILRANLKFSRSPLAYFSGPLLRVAGQCVEAGRAAHEAGNPTLANKYRMRVLQLWSLFPSMCNAPTDAPDALTDQFADILLRAMSDTRFPDLVSYISIGLKAIVQRSREAVDAAAAATAIQMADSDAEDGDDAGSDDDDDSDSDGGASRGGTTFIGATTVGAASVAGEDSAYRVPAIQRLLKAQFSLAVINKEEAERNIEALRRLTKASAANPNQNIIGSLFTVYRRLSENHDAHAPQVLEVVVAYCSIAEAKLVNTFYVQLHKLLVQGIKAAKQEAESIAEAKESDTASVKSNASTKKSLPALDSVLVFLGLTAAIVPALSKAEHLTSLLELTYPCVLDDSQPEIQKRAYKILMALCEAHPAFVLQPENRSRILDLLVSSLASCSASSKAARLKCLEGVVKALQIDDADQLSTIPALLAEVILCTKESNRRARDQAFGVLVSMGRVMEAGGAGDGLMTAAAPGTCSLSEFFKMVVAGLGGATPQMRSATVLALARLLYEFHNQDVVQDMIAPLLETVLILLQEETPQIAKAVISFSKVVIASLPKARVAELLPKMLPALIGMPASMKRHFNRKLRTVLDKLVRKFGAEELAPYMPAEDARLLTYVRKQQARRVKDRAAKHGGDAKSAEFDNMLASEDEDEEEEDVVDEDMEAATAALKGGPKRAPAYLLAVGDSVDLTEASGVGTVLSSNPASLLAAQRRSVKIRAKDKAMQHDKDGRLIIADSKDESDDDNDDDDDDDEMDGNGRGRGAGKRGMPQHRGKHARTESHGAGGANGAGAAKSAPAQIQGWGRTSSRTDETRHSGAPYRSNKAGGDVKKHDQKLEPYAYVPLDPRQMSGKGSGAQRFEHLVRSTPKGQKASGSNKRTRD